MRGRKMQFGAWAGSLCGALLAAAVMAPGNWELDTSTGLILWSGLFFLAVYLGGWIGLRVALRYNKKYMVAYPPRWAVSAILAGAMLFGIGAAGQALYMYSRETVDIPAKVDMIMLLDASGSMSEQGYELPRTDAGCQFVDSLDEDSRLQAVSFAAMVLDRSQLLVMDDSGKTALKQFITGIDSIGMTDFNNPLTEAREILHSQDREEANKAVLLLTDGEGDLDRRMVQSYLEEGIRVYSVRIDDSTSLSFRAQALADFAAATGGFDTQLIPGPDGSVDPADLLDAFQNAFQSTKEDRTAMSGNLLICSRSATVWEFVVRAVTLMLCAAAFYFGYFGQARIRPLLLHGGIGLMLAACLSAFGIAAYGVSATQLCLTVAAGYVALELEQREEMDV